jgi:hypothetical protein
MQGFLLTIKKYNKFILSRPVKIVTGSHLAFTMFWEWILADGN